MVKYEILTTAVCVDGSGPVTLFHCLLHMLHCISKKFLPLYIADRSSLD